MHAVQRSSVSLLLLTAALLGLAQWFFGNLYEAVVTVPNWQVGFEYQVLTGKSQHGDRPILYYVPVTQLAVLCVWVVTVRERRSRGAVRRWLYIASVFGLGAILLTIYIVTQLNLQLFVGGARPDLAHVAPLIQQWQVLNYGRLVLVGVTLGAVANGLRLMYHARILQGVQRVALRGGAAT